MQPDRIHCIRTHMRTRMNGVVKEKPRPVRFELEEKIFLDEAARETGMPVSEIIRRSVRLMKRQKKLVNGFGFIVDLST